MGDSGRGTVLPGEVKAVKQGVGIAIADDGTISFNSSNALGVLKTNNSAAFNGYSWPSASAMDAILFNDGSPSENTLRWLKRGLGLIVEGSSTKAFKLSIPISSTDPEVGTAPEEATSGSLYWNSSSQSLFVCVNGQWERATFGPADLNTSLLVGRYTLYVNPETGEDTFITGTYEPGITSQMVTCGYTPQKPFKTIARAALEVSRIQVALGTDSDLFDRFVIKCSPGTHLVDNSLGSNSVSAWVSGSEPNSNQLRALNSPSYSGVILPRGVSIIGEDPRKTVIRPVFVPDRGGNIETDRGSIFRMTGGNFFFNFTFKDKQDLAQSHHLLECFSFVSEGELQSYYNKVRTTFSQDSANLVVNPGETEIVAPVNPGFAQAETDNVFGSSPYVFNCSVRSKYGLCGINADGSKVTGFRSVVTSHFTGVSLQTDLTCWQRYNSSTKTWVNSISNYESFISLNPNNVRMDPSKRSFHLRSKNGAFIQAVSVFAIGHGVHHWAASGGEISVTNSNSSFGGCAAIADGYKSEAFSADRDWNVSEIRVASDISDKTNNIQRIYLGTISSISGGSWVLSSPLEESSTVPGVPSLVANKGYTLRNLSRVWVENPTGKDWSSTFTSSSWIPSTPSTLNTNLPLQNEDAQAPPVVDGISSAVGKRVYIRRVRDTRTQEERRFSLLVSNSSGNSRTPIRDYVLQTDINDSSVNSEIDPSKALIVNSANRASANGVSTAAYIVLRRGNTDKPWVANSLYRKGETVTQNQKHYTCLRENSDAAFTPENWDESYVHMESGFKVEDFFKNDSPSIIFDNDTSNLEESTTLGYNWSTVWLNDASVKSQYTSGTDYRGLNLFLLSLGFSSEEAENILLPKPKANRDLNPSVSADMGGYIPDGNDGAANSLANWAVQFRRPSMIRVTGHSWEWSGYLNYTKALPLYQGNLSPQNRFTSYFTNSNGGRVYPSGFNEEGYAVTSAGLTDLSTGITTSIDNIGDLPQTLDIPTYFPKLTVDDLSVGAKLTFEPGSEISGAPLFSQEWYTNLRQASQSQTGITRYATNSETSDGSSTSLAVSPATLKKWYEDVTFSQASQTTTGLTRYATNSETADGTSTTLAISPSTLLYANSQGLIGFPSGTRLVFCQASAPSGWTKYTGHNDKALRVVNGTSGGTGGGSISFTQAFTSRTVPLVDHSHGVNDPGHTHTGPTFQYLLKPPYVGSLTGFDNTDSGSEQAVGPGDGGPMLSVTTGLSVQAASTTQSTGNTMNFEVQYVDVIICTKD